MQSASRKTEQTGRDRTGECYELPLCEAGWAAHAGEASRPHLHQLVACAKPPPPAPLPPAPPVLLHVSCHLHRRGQHLLQRLPPAMQGRGSVPVEGVGIRVTGLPCWDRSLQSWIAQDGGQGKTGSEPWPPPSCAAAPTHPTRMLRFLDHSPTSSPTPRCSCRPGVESAGSQTDSIHHCTCVLASCTGGWDGMGVEAGRCSPRSSPCKPTLPQLSVRCLPAIQRPTLPAPCPDLHIEQWILQVRGASIKAKRLQLDHCAAWAHEPTCRAVWSSQERGRAARQLLPEEARRASALSTGSHHPPCHSLPPVNHHWPGWRRAWPQRYQPAVQGSMGG